MLSNIILTICLLFLNLIYKLFSAIQFYVIPTQFISSINYYLSNLDYLNGIINIPDLMLALGSLLSFEIVYFTVKILIFAYSLIPVIGKNSKIPKTNLNTK